MALHFSLVLLPLCFWLFVYSAYALFMPRFAFPFRSSISSSSSSSSVPVPVPVYISKLVGVSRHFVSWGDLGFIILPTMEMDSIHWLSGKGFEVEVRVSWGIRTEVRTRVGEWWCVESDDWGELQASIQLTGSVGGYVYNSRLPTKTILRISFLTDFSDRIFP